MNWFSASKKKTQNAVTQNVNPESQDLDLYWDPKMAEILETWGDSNVWNEIQMFFATSSGSVLDIACGTGITSLKLAKFPKLSVYGCDISDLLIKKCHEKGFNPNDYIVCDATKMPYSDNKFDYSYSIGSLEHFTEKGIDEFISECKRVTKKCSIHMLPVSKSETNEGWMKTRQSFFNNSNAWWIEKFRNYFSKVEVVSSKWEDSISNGFWFVCYKND